MALAQLTLVEHALCPLDPQGSVGGHRNHVSHYFYTDSQRRRRKAKVTVTCPHGLSATDEFVLWGLLAFTLSQPNPSNSLFATPHACLRYLGSVDAQQRRGGRNYELFRQSLRRLAAVNYHNDGFYDPVRGEHCEASSGFLSYRLPLPELDTPGKSPRAWRITWDPVFFEYCSAHRGRFVFDIGVYRALDPASRRLFLLLHKLFWRRPVTHRFDVRHLAVDVLGFSPALQQRDLNRKLRRCIERLAAHHVIRIPEGNRDLLVREAKGRFTVQFRRGPCFSQRQNLATTEPSVFELLRTIGLSERVMRRLIREYDIRLLQEWVDITQAAQELGKVRTTPQAYFMDNIRHARDSGRTPPDWWIAIRRQEERRTETDAFVDLQSRLGQASEPSAAASQTSGPASLAQILS